MEMVANTLKTNLKSRESDYKDYKVKVCPKCGAPIEKVTYLPGFNRYIKGPVMCKCKKEEIKSKELQQINIDKQIRLEKIMNNSLMDEKFKKSKFENWNSKLGTKKMYDLGIKYTNDFQKLKNKSVGLLIYGEPGNGKTHTAACIANSLIEKRVPVICVHIDNLLNRIKQTYNTWGKEGEETVLKSLVNADLLIIDDLGTEQDTDWSRTKIYNILDSRYRNGLPLIITTNIPLTELKKRYHARTYDRLLEMCTPVLNDGKSIRIEKAKEKTKIVKDLLS